MRVLAALDGGLETGAGGELRHLAARDGDSLAGTRVHALALTALGDVELAEAGEVDGVAGLERIGDPVEDGLDRVSGLLLRLDPLVCGNPIDEFSLGHGSVPFLAG